MNGEQMERAATSEQPMIRPELASSEEATIPPSDPASHKATIPPRSQSSSVQPSRESNSASVGAKVRYFGDHKLLEEIARGGRILEQLDWGEPCLTG